MRRVLLAALLSLICAGWALLAVRNAGRPRAPKRRFPGIGAFGWALLFLTSGRMPPPPPETQIEQETKGEKDRGSSQPLRDSKK